MDDLYSTFEDDLIKNLQEINKSLKVIADLYSQNNC